MNYEINYIEKLGISDIGITELLSQVYVEAGFVKPEIAKSIFTASSVRQRGKIIGAREISNREFVGMIVIVYPDSDECRFQTENEVEFHLLAVKTKHRGKGLGKALVYKAIDEIRQGGYTKILLATQKQMYPAHKLYESLGFSRKENLDFVRSGISFLVYEKIIQC